MIRSQSAVAAALAFVVISLGAVDFSAELGTDYGAYFSHGYFMARGLVPYRDFWTHKTPLLPMFLALWIHAFGTGFYATALFPLLMTFVAATVLFLLAQALELPLTTAIGAALLFAFFAASHVVDPTRNGVIVIAAAVFEMLALLLLIRGVKSEQRVYLAAAGWCLGLAVAARQTAAVTYVPLLLVIVLQNWRNRVARTTVDITVMSAAAATVAIAFAVYFSFHAASFSAIWDQIFRFNLIYAAGYRVKLTWWLSGWAQLAWRDGLVIFVVGVGWCAWRRFSRGPGSDATIILATMAVAHLAVIYLARKVQGMYLFQLLPELCIATALAATDAFGEAESTRADRSRRVAVACVMVALVAWPLALEAGHWRRAIAVARNGQYLFDSSRLPSLVQAQRIQQLAPGGEDRIWVFAASHDALYPFSQRLPALRDTSTARLAYATSPDDFERWRMEFEARRPGLVVSFYGDRFANRYRNPPDTADGRSTVNILRIRDYLIGHLRRVNDADGLPEIFAAE